MNKITRMILAKLLKHERMGRFIDKIGRRFGRGIGIKCRKCKNIILLPEYYKEARWLAGMHKDCFFSMFDLTNPNDAVRALTYPLELDRINTALRSTHTHTFKIDNILKLHD